MSRTPATLETSVYIDPPSTAPHAPQFALLPDKPECESINGIYTVPFLTYMLALCERQQRNVPDWRGRLSEYGRLDCQDMIRLTSANYTMLKRFLSVMIHDGRKLSDLKAWRDRLLDLSRECLARKAELRNGSGVYIGEEIDMIDYTLTCIDHFKCLNCNAIFTTPDKHTHAEGVIDQSGIQVWYSCPVCHNGSTFKADRTNILQRPGWINIPGLAGNNGVSVIMRQCVPIDWNARDGSVLRLPACEDRIAECEKKISEASASVAKYVHNVLEYESNPPQPRP